MVFLQWITLLIIVLFQTNTGFPFSININLVYVHLSVTSEKGSAVQRGRQWNTVYSWANSQWPNKDWWLVLFAAGGNAGLGKLSLYTRRQLYSKHWQFIELLVCSPARGLKGEHLCLSTFWPPSASIWLKPAQSKSNSCATVNTHLPGNAACRKDQKLDIERRTTKN